MDTIKLIERLNEDICELKIRLRDNVDSENNTLTDFITEAKESDEDLESISNLIYEIAEDSEYLWGYVAEFNYEISDNKYRR